MLTLHTIDAMRSFRQGKEGLVPFVPTMGALHEGHVSLVRQARALADAAGRRGTVLASIFVNPTQFGPNEDFGKYPRTLESDQAMLKAAGCDAVFVPSAEEMYPGIRQTSTEHSARTISVDPGPLGDILEGAIRPGHFRGVCTVVAKLLNITQPTHLLLGQKDFQQQLVLRQMCTGLNMPVQVVTCPTLREPDGLAMSSRNRYLSEPERARAAALSQALDLARQGYANGKHQPGPLEHLMRAHLEKDGLEIQYAVVRHQHTLAEFSNTINGPAVALLAVKLGATRLIDNQLLN
jgi:pantoate--beta-alanine ligase